MRTLKNGRVKKQWYWLVLLLVCAGSAALVLPTINNNIDDPGLIVYFSGDEGFSMDLVWLYYSGETRDSMRGDWDYGLELVYLAYFARTVLSHFVEFTPGTFILILLWLHLLAWICALVALWRLVDRHFGRGWQPALAVMLLATRPAFAYLANNSKPEPLVLLFMIVGLDYSLRIIEKPSLRNLLMATACGAIALVVKFAGIFLLPAIVGSMYFARRYNSNIDRDRILREVKIAWILPALIGTVMIIMPVLAILFYVRKSTGATFYEQFGLWGGVLETKYTLYIWLTGLFCMVLSPTIRIIGKHHNLGKKKIVRWINEVNSYAFITCGIFAGFIVVFGIGWIISPKYFLLTYAPLFPVATIGAGAYTMTSETGLIFALVDNLVLGTKKLDPYILLLFFFYLGIEVYRRKYKHPENSQAKFFKRMVLVVFLLLPLAMIFTEVTTMRQHNILPFFVAMSILAIQGAHMLYGTLKMRGWSLVKSGIIMLIAAFFVVDILINGLATVNARVYEFRQHEDVVFDIAKWWRKNIEPNVSVVADHPYIPPGHKNIWKVNGFQMEDRVEKMRQLVNEHHPELIYFSQLMKGQKVDGPRIEELLPGKKVELIKSFQNTGGRYGHKDIRQVIYRVFY